MKIPHSVEQLAIFILTVGAVAMVSLGHWLFWGHVMGACSTYFWIHSALSAKPKQFGSVATSAALLVVWVAGVIRYW